VSKSPFEGATPPNDPAAERALAGAVLICGNERPAAVNEIIGLVPADDFYSGALRRVWEAIADLASRDESADAVSVSKALRERGRLAEVGGMPALGELMLAPVTMTDKALKGYAKTVMDLATRRRFIVATQRALALAYSTEVATDELVGETEEKIHQLGQSVRKNRSTTRTMREAVEGAYKRLHDHSLAGGGIMGFSTGFPELDDMLGGLHREDITVIAGRPAMGKSALAMNLAVNVGLGGRGVVAFSLEMPNEQLAMRAMGSDGRVDLGEMRRGQIDRDAWTRLTASARKMSNLKHFYIDDGGDTSLADVRTKCLKLQRDMQAANVELGLVMIDYLQLVNTAGNAKDNRERALAEVSAGLKRLAKELKAPVIALSQLNRSLESRADKRPMLSDLRESGAIEQDADNVVFLYRDEYYNAKTDKPGICEVIVAKQRNGAVGALELGFHSKTATFQSLVGNQS
jgi:replicative DNA helicase